MYAPSKNSSCKHTTQTGTGMDKGILQRVYISDMLSRKHQSIFGAIVGPSEFSSFFSSFRMVVCDEWDDKWLKRWVSEYLVSCQKWIKKKKEKKQNVRDENVNWWYCFMLAGWLTGWQASCWTRHTIYWNEWWKKGQYWNIYTCSEEHLHVSSWSQASHVFSQLIHHPLTHSIRIFA